MFRNYLKIAWRGIKRNKLFSFINVFGLSAGLVCCFLIVLFIVYETSYDRHHKLGDRLYQIGTISKIEGEVQRYSTIPFPMASTMQQEFPEIESFTRLMKLFQDDKTLIQYKNGQQLKSFYEDRGYMADSNFFQLFKYKFIEGNQATALHDPGNIVIREDIARKIFGKESALNKIIHVNSSTNGEADLKVSGVFIEPSSPSHLDIRFVMNIQHGEVGKWVRQISDYVNNNMFYSYLLLKPQTDPKQLEKKFEDFINRHAGADLKASGRERKQFLTQIKDIHLYANTRENVTPPGSIWNLRLLSAIALITLMIACVNFMNLSTARSVKRATEIGMRKVMGAERPMLMKQFLSEALLFSIIAYVIALILTILLLPLFKQISGKELEFSWIKYGELAVLFFFITLTTGLIAGLYPAFYLSAFRPILVLKGKFSNSLTAISFRKVLVVFQFTISAVLIIASITISNQMRYMRNKDLGFQKNLQIVIPLRSTQSKNMLPAFKTELRSVSSIQNAGGSVYYPGIRNITDFLLYKQGDKPDQTVPIVINLIDNSFLQTLEIKPVAGRLFSGEFPADTARRIVITRKASESFGYKSPEEAIGKNLIMQFGKDTYMFPVIGVINNFHFEGLRDEIKPFGFILVPDQQLSYLTAHVKGNQLQTALMQMTALWKKLNPNEPFEYSFMDQDFQKNYIAEERLSALIKYFTIIAIIISCLGLLGLTSFSVEQRTREIGIRKILGASAGNIVGLLSRDFLKLVMMAGLVAAPIAWFFMNRWLEDFSYRVDLSWTFFIAAMVIVIIIAFLTISLQAVKAALTNPVKNLRTE